MFQLVMPQLVDRCEEIIAVEAEARKLNLFEVFRKNDRLKTDYLTGTQICSLLECELGLSLSEEQRRSLIERYTSSNGYFNYKEFSQAINTRLNHKVLIDGRNPAYDPDVSIVKPLSADASAHAQSILAFLANSYKQRKIDVAKVFASLDPKGTGLVPKDVFLMHMPEEEKLEYENLVVLTHKYSDPKNPSQCNYIRFTNDLACCAKSLDSKSVIQMPMIEGYSNKEDKKDALSEVLTVIEKIQVLCFKFGIRSIEFFKDYDKLRLGLCLEDEFKAGLDLFTRKFLHLSVKQLNDLTNFYRVPDDGRIYYRAFTDLIENTFNIPNLDKQPLAEVQRPLQGILQRQLNPLEDVDEGRLEVVMSELAHRVKDRRLMVFPFFKDFDRGKCYSGNVTKNQFARILAILGLTVQPEDFRLLCKKFEEQHKGDINYPAFVQAIDYLFLAFRTEVPKPAVHVDAPMWHELPLDTSNVNLTEIIGRIKEHCMVNRIRISEGFKDFDNLREYSITNSQFRRGLMTSRIGLSNAEAEVLCSEFRDPKRNGRTLWKAFCDEVDQVFTQVIPNMERTPLNFPLPQDSFRMPHKGGMDWTSATVDHQAMVNNCIQRFKAYISGRRLLVKPTFEKFDKLNHRYVSRYQFKQCLAMLDLACTDEEMGALEAKFSDDKGFNYFRFLQELEPPAQFDDKYAERMEELKLVNTMREKLELEYEPNFDRLMTRLKTYLMKKPVRVVEFMKDFDRFSHNTISKHNFIRAMDICGFQLEEPEKEIIYNHYQSATQPGQVVYRRFCDDLEAVFTTHEMEKRPHFKPEQWHPQPAHVENELTPDALKEYEACMMRLANRVLPTRMQLFPPFRDFDKHNKGTVTREQFKRVLNEQLNLGGYMTERDYSILFNKFLNRAQPGGGMPLVDYVPFCHEVYKLAHIDYQAP
ncbi:uncharacterized protein LOC142351824 isoform X2 [Convolutriloba macropyga]|uniref:uncharacterized protein LOC142351824 isoform X2 n=1 Tax=Convolutriloba macropyga TaxID=536237 RepID=UPI003F51C4FC